MLQFRYDTTGRWYKGNLHAHTQASDGGLSLGETAALYAQAGFDFLGVTDHWVAYDSSADKEKRPLVLLDGIELHGDDGQGAFYHVVCLGDCRGLTHEMGLVSALETARARGALLILAHPFWTGNSLDEAARWNFHGVEVYNHVCHWLNGKGDSGVHWNALLGRNPDVLGPAVDDCHLCPEHPLWNGGWVMVNAAQLTRDGIMAALRAGNFYSSQGPSFDSIACDGHNLHLKTSPVRFVRLAGPGWLGNRVRAEDEDPITEVVLPFPSDWPYVYAEIEDAAGRCAWTNTLARPTS